MEQVEASFDGNVMLEDYSWVRYYDGEDTETYYDDFFVHGIYDTAFVTEEESVSRGAEVIAAILQDRSLDYNVCGIHMTYFNKNGTYKYSIPVGRETVTKEMLEASATKVSYEDNSALLEKWEAFFSEQKNFWTIEGEDYKVSLKGWEAFGDYQLILEQGDKKTLIKTYERYEGEPQNMSYDTYEDILGYDGFYIYTNQYPSVGKYFTVENGEVFCLAETAGSHEECFSVDVNGDGVTEFINNYVWGTGG